MLWVSIDSQIEIQVLNCPKGMAGPGSAKLLTNLPVRTAYLMIGVAQVLGAIMPVPSAKLLLDALTLVGTIHTTVLAYAWAGCSCVIAMRRFLL